MTTSSIYTKYRDELTDLLEEAEALSEKHIDRFITRSDSEEVTAGEEIRRVKEKLLSNQFSITLCGGFQSGKSTTFNALCGGRELSPVGFGIKTSGCLVRAINLPSSAEEEHALVFWRSKEKMLLGFDQFLGADLAEAAIESDIGYQTGGGFFDWFDLDLPNHRELLKKVTASKFEEWLQNPASFSAEDLDILRIAHLIGSFWKSEFVKNLKSDGPLRTNLEDVKKLMAFPEDWETRWVSGSEAAFSAEEIAFVFIDEVHLHVHSPNLERLGCVLVDAPGLFASSWDSLISDRAFQNTDAIFFLFDGSRTVTQGDIEVLKQIDQRSKVDILFVGCNLRGQQLKHTEKLLDASLNRLQALGMRVPEESVAIYHARLAYNTSQFLSTNLEAMASNPEHPQASPDLSNIILQDLMVYPDFSTAFKCTSQEVSGAYEKSGLPDLLNSIENFILQRRAHYALVKFGSAPLINAIERVEGGLLLEENSADQKVEEQKSLFSDAESKLISFEQSTEQLLKAINPHDTNFDREILEELLDELKERINSLLSVDTTFEKGGLGNSLVDNIVENLLSNCQLFRKVHKDENKRNEFIEEKIIIPAINDILNEPLLNELRKYINDIQNPKKFISKTLVSYMERVQITINTLWKKTKEGTDLKVLSGVDIDSLSLNIHEDFSSPVTCGLVNDIHADISNLGFWQRAASWTGVIAWSTIVLVTIVSPFLGPLGPITALIFGGLYLKSKSKFKEKAKTQITNELKKNWEVIIDDLESKVVVKEGEIILIQIFHTYFTLFKKLTKSPRKEFVNRLNRAKEGWQLAEADRKRLAENARKIRSTEVTPLRERLDDFLDRASKEFPLPN